MSLIDQLIQMKKSEKENDIIKMIDEFTLYNKLSSVKALGGIEDSPAMQKKLPYMTKFIEGNFYQLSLAITAIHILTHLEYNLPPTIQEKIENIPERTKKQLTLVSKSSVQPTFQELMQYDHKTESDFVVGVYTKEVNNETKIIIITNPSGNRYVIYQGDYIETEDKELRARNKSTLKHKDYLTKLNKGTLSIGNYSMAGNNHYPFAEYNREGIIYYLSIPNQDIIRLSTRPSLAWSPDKKENTKTECIHLTHEEKNRMGLSRQNIDKFADVVADIINRWEEE